MSVNAGAEQWNEVGGSTLLKWDAAKELQGVFKGEVAVTESKYNQPKFAVETQGAEGAEIVEFFAPAILARLLRSPSVKVGSEVLIKYTGSTTTTKGGRQAKDFAVMTR